MPNPISLFRDEAAFFTLPTHVRHNSVDRKSPMTGRQVQYIILGCLLAAGAFMCVSTAIYANKSNGGNGFPLDDPWIHLQFAKNLHEYGAYSYFKNEMVTSGSTSPLYTLVLSLGYFATSNEMLMSYAFGAAFFLLGAVYMFKLASLEFDNIVLAAGAACLFLSEPRLLWISLSGMETTLFIALLLAVLYYYRIRKAVPFGILSGLLLWARPEALLFGITICVDVAYNTYVTTTEGGKKRPKIPDTLSWLKLPAVIALSIAGAYFAWNLWLSGSIFPNTFAAKLKYYANGGGEYPLQVFHYFTDGHLGVFAFFVLLGILSLVVNVVKKRAQPLLIPFIFSLGMFFVYWKDLPYLYQEGRYLMPVLPFAILLGIGGMKETAAYAFRFIPRLRRPALQQIVVVLLALIPAAQFAYAGWEKRVEYAEYCAYISNRQVRTARWLHENLPPDARIATHDVGAIAYYSERKIVDMVGLISPEMIARIGNLDGLVQFMNSKKVTHLAVLRNWFELDNDNPIFQTDVEHPEIMEVFEYHPKGIHFLARDAVQLLDAGQYYASMNDFSTAGKLFVQAVQRDPRSSKAHMLLASALLRVGKAEDAGKEFRASLQLHPANWDAKTGLAQVALQEHQTDYAIAILDSVITGAPEYIEGYRLLADIYRMRRMRRMQIDTVKAEWYTRKAEEIARRRSQ